MTLQALALVLGLVWVAVVALLWRALARLEAAERRAEALEGAEPAKHGHG